MARRGGEDFIYSTFAEGGSPDAYGDNAYTINSTPDTIRGVRSDGGNRMTIMETGEERKVDMAVLVASPLINVLGVVVAIEDDTTKRAATLTDASGRIYTVVGVGDEAKAPVGSQRLFCIRQAD